MAEYSKRCKDLRMRETADRQKTGETDDEDINDGCTDPYRRKKWRPKWWLRHPEESLVTEALSLGCEYVLGQGYYFYKRLLARVSIVNMYGYCIYDKFVKQRGCIISYRTKVTGIQHEDLYDGIRIKKVRSEVRKLLKGRIVVGYNLREDFNALHLKYSRQMTRDPGGYIPLWKITGVNYTPSIKLLAKKVLGINLSSGLHDTVVEASVLMRVYITHRERWENDLRNNPPRTFARSPSPFI